MNHYGTLAGALEYQEARGNTEWGDPSKTDEQRTAALVRASLSLDGQYGKRFSGAPTGGRTQRLAWPRYGAMDYCAGEMVPSDEVPVEVEEAAYAMAALELKAPNSTNPSFTLGALNKREQVGKISRERFGTADGMPLTLDAQRVQLAEVSDLLRCLLIPASNGRRVLRV